MNQDKKSGIGFIGLGDMGLPMAMNLLKAGFQVTGYDLREEAVKDCVKAGGQRTDSIEALVKENQYILTTLPSSSAFIKTVEEKLLPHAFQGQIFIELGTTIPYEIERLSKAFREKGAFLLDVPVSGGAIGAQRGDLLMFAGGDKEVIEKCRPILSAIGGPDRIHYCGESGYGQKMKGVNQLKMGILNAAVLEVLAFAVKSGLSPQLVQEVFPDANWSMVTNMAGEIEAGKGEEIGVKFRELPYYLNQAEKAGFSLPLTETLYAFCDKGERVVVDDHREAPSFWHELMKE